ncbi:MAG: hypothetical protein AAFY88_30515, partial [Acidobacteriota bacterium]
ASPLCEDASVLRAGEMTAAEVVAIDVDGASLLELSWDGGGAPHWLPCGDVDAKRLDSTSDTLRMVVEHSGTVHFARSASGAPGSPGLLRVDVEAIDVQRGSFWLDFERRRLAVEHTAYLPAGAGAGARALASYVELLDGSGPTVRRLATAAIAATPEARGVARRLGMVDPAVTSVLLRRTAEDLWTTGAATKNEQQTDPDPPGDGGDAMTGKDWTGRSDEERTRNEQQTDPDPPGDGGDAMTGKDWTGREGRELATSGQLVDLDPPLSGTAVTWRALVASPGEGAGAAAHLEVLGWIAPVLWPELEPAARDGAERRLLALGSVD